MTWLDKLPADVREKVKELQRTRENALFDAFVLAVRLRKRERSCRNAIER